MANPAVLTLPFENHLPKPQSRRAPHWGGAGAEGKPSYCPTNAASLKEETVLHETFPCFHPVSTERPLDRTQPQRLLRPRLGEETGAISLGAKQIPPQLTLLSGPSCSTCTPRRGRPLPLAVQDAKGLGYREKNQSETRYWLQDKETANQNIRFAEFPGSLSLYQLHTLFSATLKLPSSHL